MAFTFHLIELYVPSKQTILNELDKQNFWIATDHPSSHMTTSTRSAYQLVIRIMNLNQFTCCGSNSAVAASVFLSYKLTTNMGRCEISATKCEGSSSLSTTGLLFLGTGSSTGCPKPSCALLFNANGNNVHSTSSKSLNNIDEYLETMK